MESSTVIVAGVDFGTLSVRVSIFDSVKGRLGSATGEYPLTRKKEDPDYATQSHRDHMEALVAAMRRALDAAGVDGGQLAALALDTTGSSVIPVGERMAPLDDYYLWCDHRSNGAGACTRRSGGSRSCCTGCAPIRTSGRGWSRHWNIAIWWPRCCAASRMRARRRAVSVRWGTNGCGTGNWADCPPRNSW